MTLVEHSYAGDTATLNHARTDLGDHLQANGLDPMVADAQLVLSELISNAIQASPDREYHVGVSIGADRVAIAVSNATTAALPDQQDWAPDDVLSTQGRGLSIVNALSESVEIETTSNMVTVTAILIAERV